MLRYLVLVTFVTYCSASGGGAHGGGNSMSVEGESDSVIILQPPKPLKLTCNGTGVIWYKNQQALSSVADRLSAFPNGTLEITTSENADVGVYECQKDNNVISEWQVVTLSYTRLTKSTTAISGDSFVLTCDVTGDPVPQIFWSKDDVEIVPDDRITLGSSTNSTGAPPNSTLTVSQVLEGDRGVYTCTFDNSNGEMLFKTSTTVRVKSLYAALWPFLGIVAEVVVLCCIILFYEHRRSNLDDDEGDDTSKAGR